MHDGIIFERQGKPAAVVCTEPFIPMARASAEAAGIPDYPFAIIAHPLGRIDDATLKARVAAALPQVVDLLTR